MTKPNPLPGSSSDSCFLRVRQSALMACLSGQMGCARCAHLCARAAFRPAFWSLPPGCASPLHEVLCFRGHDFAAWIVGVVGRSGFSGNVFGGICGCGVRSVDRVQVCGIRNFFRVVLVWLIRHGLPVSGRAATWVSTGACSQRPRACWRARMTGNVRCITRRPWVHGVLSRKLRVVGRITEAEPLSGAAGFVLS